VRPAAAKQGLETPLELWGYFVGQCKKHLHIVLCMSPIGGAFRSVKALVTWHIQLHVLSLSTQHPQSCVTVAAVVHVI
jgi:hypothetical protein